MPSMPVVNCRSLLTDQLEKGVGRSNQFRASRYAVTERAVAEARIDGFPGKRFVLPGHDARADRFHLVRKHHLPFVQCAR